MIVYIRKRDGWSHTKWKSLISVKRWATRNAHAWQMKGDLLVVSKADGGRHEYMQKQSMLERKDG